jgi:hypothetical protein
MAACMGWQPRVRLSVSDMVACMGWQPRVRLSVSDMAACVGWSAKSEVVSLWYGGMYGLTASEVVSLWYGGMYGLTVYSEAVRVARWKEERSRACYLWGARLVSRSDPFLMWWRGRLSLIWRHVRAVGQLLDHSGGSYSGWARSPCDREVDSLMINSIKNSEVVQAYVFALCFPFSERFCLRCRGLTITASAATIWTL